MGFLTSLIGSGVKTVLSPLAAASDVLVDGDLGLPKTGDILGSAVEDLGDSFDSLFDGDLI